MERFWCLRWLAQNEIKHTDAVLLKDDLLRLLEIPLVIPMTGVRYARGTQLTLELIDWDEVDLTVQARVLEVVTMAATSVDEMALEEADALNEEEQVAELVVDVNGDARTDANAASMVEAPAMPLAPSAGDSAASDGP
jgi:exoribonuclease-2